MERKKSRFSIFTKSNRKTKEKRISEETEPKGDLPIEPNNEPNLSQSNSAADTTSLNPFEDDIEDESDAQTINSPDIRRLQQQADYTTGTSDHCATPSEISETYDDVEEPYFMRTQTGQMRRSTAASKKRNSNYSIRSKMSSLPALKDQFNTNSQTFGLFLKLIAVECLIDLYSPWGITARQAKAAFLIEGENVVRAADRIQNLIRKSIQSAKDSK